MKIFAPAKINWAIDIVGIREDGYHFVDMIMQQIELYDYITLDKNDNIIITCDVPSVPTDEKNLCYKAAELYFIEAGIKAGVSVRIEKHIPLEAGLAGGSTDAAAVLIGLNRIYKEFSEEDLLKIGAKIGADVPYCIAGGIKRATNIGEVLKPINSKSTYDLVLVKPPFGANTKLVYQSYDKSTFKKTDYSKKVIEALKTSDPNVLAKSIGNALEPVTFTLLPHMKDIKNDIINSGALGAVMSGTGTCLIGLYENEIKAETAQSLLKKQHSDCFVFKAKTI